LRAEFLTHFSSAAPRFNSLSTELSFVAWAQARYTDKLPAAYLRAYVVSIARAGSNLDYLNDWRRLKLEREV
jgi:hypothetical protein